MANVVKDIGEIWSRLFDHRPFLNGEIKYFVREFEEKRGDREIEGLFQVLETLTEIKDSQIERIKLCGTAHLPAVDAKVDHALARCSTILDREPLFRQDDSVQRRRVVRKTEWESFIEDISHKCAKVDETFAEKETDLRHFYQHLENKLHISPAHHSS